MGIADRLKDLKTKAVDATAEHSDKIHEAVEKVATTADQRTGGKYHERIQQAGAKAGSLVDSLKGPEQQAAAEGPDDAPEAAGVAAPADPPPAADAPGEPADGASQI
jgi:hypothetical protein